MREQRANASDNAAEAGPVAASSAVRTSDVECVCGAPIKRVTLPPDLARASGADAFWMHVGGDIYCYGEDEQAMAEPLEATDG